MRRFWWICLAAAWPAFAQNAPGSDRLRLVYADSLVGITDGGGAAKKLSGHVRLVQGDAFLDCRESIWHENENRVSLFGNVMIHDGKRTLRADRVDVDGAKKTETAFGNVTLESGKRILYAGMLKYAQADEMAFAEENVRLEDLIEKAVIRANRMVYDRRNDTCRADLGPVLTKTDTVTHQTWNLTGKTMEAWGKTQSALASDSVVFIRGDLRGEGQKAEYHTKPGRILLTASPVVRQAARTMKGDSITVLVDQGRFAGATVRGRAEIITSDSTGRDELRGETVTVEAVQDTVRRILVENRAESVNRVFDAKGRKQGVNTASGDRIEIWFGGGQVRRVVVTSRPGLCAGTYTPGDGRVPADQARRNVR
jgi:lipopolysaccharide export system protein LptA